MTTLGVLVMAYGGPARLEEVEPYLLEVRRGRPTPHEIVREVRERYRRIGGGSPILERTRRQAEALEEALNRGEAFSGRTGPGGGDGVAYRAFVGMRHWRPTIHEALAEMAAAGIARAVGLVMAPHFSRLSVGAYQRQVREAGSPVEVSCIDTWHLLPGYLDALGERVRAALERFLEPERAGMPILFTAHSLPSRILEWEDPYPRELEATAAALAAQLDPPGRPPRCHLAYQSVALTPDPWLGPDAKEVIERLASEGKRHVLVAPIGFVCEHVEILYDVDIALREQAERLGMRLERIEMLNDAPPLVAALAGLVRGRAREKGWA